MKKLVISAAAFLISFTGFAQNENLDYKFAIKANSHLSLQFYGYKADFNYGDIYRNPLIQSGFSLEWLSTNKNSQEVFVKAGYKVFPKLNHGQAYHQHYSVGYNYFVNFNKNKNARVVPALGAGLNFYYDKLYLEYFRELKTESERYGTQATITPRIQFFTGSRLFAEVSLPFYLADLSTGDYFYTDDVETKKKKKPLYRRGFPDCSKPAGWYRNKIVTKYLSQYL